MIHITHYKTHYKIFLLYMSKTRKNIHNIQKDFYGYINNDWIESHQNQIKKKYILQTLKF